MNASTVECKVILSFSSNCVLGCPKISPAILKINNPFSKGQQRNRKERKEQKEGNPNSIWHFSLDMVSK
jgi:hypothetical protein